MCAPLEYQANVNIMSARRMKGAGGTGKLEDFQLLLE